MSNTYWCTASAVEIPRRVNNAGHPVEPHRHRRGSRDKNVAERQRALRRRPGPRATVADGGPATRRRLRGDDLRAQWAEPGRDLPDRVLVHSVLPQDGDQVRRHPVKGIAGDAQPGMCLIHGAALVRTRAAERGGDEHPLMPVEPVHVDTVEVALQIGIIERAPVQLVDNFADCRRSADGVVDRHVRLRVLVYRDGRPRGDLCM
jgi:hypothetical protein